MAFNFLSELKSRIINFNQQQIDSVIAKHVQHSYPSNHCYRISGKQIIPYRKLADRFQVIQEQYPSPLTSLVDLSSCKGYFVFEAGQRETCHRAMGIDIHEKNLHACQVIKQHIKNDKLHFQAMRLHELADRIDEFGGQFQTALLINTYQYLYFGSDLDAFGYLSHDAIFQSIAKICRGRLIFNNRTELQDCQNKAEIELAGDKAALYSSKHILEAASRYFQVTNVGELGGYPLWVFDRITSVSE